MLNLMEFQEELFAEANPFDRGVHQEIGADIDGGNALVFLELF